MCAYTHTEERDTYYDESVHMIIEAEKSYCLPSVSQKPRKSGEVIPVWV